MITPDDLIQVARTYIGTKYVHHGRSHSKGVDCVGLLIAVADDLGLKMSNHTSYNKVVEPSVLMEGILQNCTPVKRSELAPGCVVLMEFSNWAGATHVGLITHNNNVIHSYESRGEVVEHKLAGSWEKRVKGVFKINGVDYG